MGNIWGLVRAIGGFLYVGADACHLVFVHFNSRRGMMFCLAGGYILLRVALGITMIRRYFRIGHIVSDSTHHRLQIRVAPYRLRAIP